MYLEKVVEPARENSGRTDKLTKIIKGAGLVLGAAGVLAYANYSEQKK